MLNLFRWITIALLCLGMTQVVWADDLEGEGPFSRQLLFETLESSLDLERDPDFTPEENEEFETLFHDFAGNPELTDDEVFALNKSLNNARHNPWTIDFTTEENLSLMDSLIENDFTSRQIKSLTKALESEAKFLAHYDRTGKEFFLSKAATEKNKFLSRIGELDNDDDPVMTHDANRAALLLARQEARSALKGMARQARLQAKTLAKETTRSNSRGLSRNSAKQLAQEVRRQLKKSNRPSKGNQGKNK